MKIQFKLSIPVFTLMGCSILFNSCKGAYGDICEETNTYKEYSISQNTLDQTPYRKDGLDTLVYVSTIGDTAILYGKGVQKRYAQDRVDETPNPDCQTYTNYKFQVIDYTYIGNQPAFNRLTFYLYNYISSGMDEVANYTSKTQYNVAFMNITQSSGAYRVGFINNAINYNDSIIVNNITYYGKKMYSSTIDSIMVLYNNTYGAMKVEKEGKIWIKKF